MTTILDIPTTTERELSERLQRLAAKFIVDLDRQGRLVEPGGAEALKRLRAQFEARRSHTAIYQAAVDSIVDDCSYPRAVAMQIADVLHLRGLLAEHDGPEPQHDREPDPASLAPDAVGARVVRRVKSPNTPREHALAPELVEDRLPQMRPSAAIAADEATVVEPDAYPADWSEEYARAVTAAAKLQSDHATRPELSAVAAHRDCVTVAIKATSLDDWGYWLTAIGAPIAVTSHQAGYAQLAVGTVEGVEIHLTAHEVPRLLEEAADAAGEPFMMWGRIYDLTRGYRDRFDNFWSYLGERQESGMPLLCLRGTDGPMYPLGSIIVSNGPLSLVELPATGPTANVAGGEA
ncbi:BN159_2729 family protein [Streptomyces sp. NPDC002769]|uniref:BN159_2729 family protein n=1 Tax=Streptomyces sp. NPDC002769 TaxID=3154542 RepID=UPI003332B7DA